MRGMCIICTVDRTERYIKKRNTSFRSVRGAFVCSGNFRHGDRRTDGVILLLLFIGFLVWMVRSALKAHAASAEAEDPSGEYKIYPAWKCALYIVGGAVAIKFGGILL